MSLTSWTTSTMAFFSFAISIASLVMFSKHKDIDGGLCAVYLGLVGLCLYVFGHLHCKDYWSQNIERRLRAFKYATGGIFAVSVVASSAYATYGSSCYRYRTTFGHIAFLKSACWMFSGLNSIILYSLCNVCIDEAEFELRMQ